MTTHPTDGELRAYLDGESPPREGERIAAHVDRCAPCAAREAELRAAEAEASRALAPLDPRVDPTPARARVRRSLAGHGEGNGRVAPDRWPVARAAVVVLALAVAAGAAAAIPGSPLRAWVDAARERLTEPDPAPQVPAGTAPREGREEPAGVRIEASAGSVRIVLAEVGPGTRIRVRLVDGAGAGVFGGPGTRFRTGPGTVEARVSGDEVRVEVPRSATRASVTVNGRPFFLKTGDRLELPGPVRDTVESEFRFRLPGGGEV